MQTYSIDEIVDSISYRFRPTPYKVLSGALSIQNINNVLCQVDDVGNITPIIGGGGGGLSAITGDVVATGPGVVTSTIQPGVVTYAKIQNVSNNVILGNVSGGATTVQELTAAQVRTLLALAPVATTGSASDLTSGTLPAGRFPALTGDVTTIAGALATTVNIPANRIPFGDVSGHMTTAAVLNYSSANSRLTVATSGSTVAGTTQFGQIQSLGDATIPGGALHFMAYEGRTSAPTIQARFGFVRSGGTFDTPTIVGNTDSVGMVQHLAHDGSGYRIPIRMQSFVDITSGAIVASTYLPLNHQVSMGPANSVVSAALLYSATGDLFSFATADLATNATGGFMWPPAMAGSPVGTPLGANWSNATAVQASAHGVPSVVDTTNHRQYFYVGGAWHYAAINDGASSGITELTGDIAAGPGTGIVSSTINNNVVTLAKMATMATTSLLGRSTAGTGNVEVISIGSGLTLSGGTLSSSSSGGTITALTGDVTASGSGSVVATIANDAVTTVKILNANVTTAKIANLAVTTGLLAANAVTYAKMQTQADQTLLGNVSGGTAVPSALVGSQVEALLFGSLASGILSVTATTGVIGSTALTATDVLFAVNANTIGQDGNFQYNSTTHELFVPKIHAAGSGSLTLETAAVSLLLNNGPATAQLSGGFEIQGVTGAGSVGEALLFSKTGDQAITKSGGALYVGTIAAHEVNVLVNNVLVAFWSTAGDLVPGTDDTYNLGSSSSRWATVYGTVVDGGAHGLGLVSSANINIQPQTGGNIQLDATAGSGNVSIAASGSVSLLHGGTTAIKVDTTGVGFLGHATAGPQTGGSATAGVVYTATEQAMLQKAYDCLRTFGFLN